MQVSLDGKSVIVTGAGGGIGRDSALVLAEAGARLVLSDIADEQGQATLEAVRAYGGTAVFKRADLSVEDQVIELTKTAVDEFGRLDGAFNNAGVEQVGKSLNELSIQEWNRAISVDLTSVFLCIKHQANAMLSSGGGAIVNTASSLGLVAIPNACEYVAAKHGVIGLTRAAAVDFGAKGIRVNAVLPGIIGTPMIQRLSSDPQFSAMFDQLRNRHPIGRFGEPSEIGEAVKWMLSDASSFMNGAAVTVDGGYSAN